MKNILFCAVAFAFYSKTFSQSLLNSTGTTLHTGAVSVEYSIGEIGITTLSGSLQYTTQGFHQPIIEFKDCNLIRFLPNAITPNNDNLNDCFGVKNWPTTSSFELSIFNRGGELVFKTSNPLECWNGEFRNHLQPSGTFVYLIKANTTTCGPVSSKGTVTIIR
ncbi:MAG TPA: gliding motility-associated C-terminal domain-containing protein [Chitinophagaceae bacterium]|jgi:gliding motility-associated-like protein|nr:gliding motility-associated C-terminal domain-containing protein [Chitinophagaceae bacterium]